MSACEQCWRDANQRALLLGGSVTDHYHDLLEERRDNPCKPPKDPAVSGGPIPGDGRTREERRGERKMISRGAARLAHLGRREPRGEGLR